MFMEIPTKLSSLLAIFAGCFLLTSCSPAVQDYCGASTKIVGTEATDFLNGGIKDECIFGLAGNDVLSGGDGNDVIDSGEGSDGMQGGLGNDTFVINLGDHMDVIADTGGQDTVQFGRGVTLEAISASIKDGVISIQIEDADTWSYVTIAPDYQDDDTVESVVENFILPGGKKVDSNEFVASVSPNAMSIRDFSAKIVTQRTVEVTESNQESDLFAAVLNTVRNTLPEELCIRPALSPAPDELQSPVGRFRPEDYFAVFYGRPETERSVAQREQYRALAAVGIMRREDLESRSGIQGEKFSLTMEGWGYMNQRGCIHYATLEVQQIDSYLPTGRKREGMELYSVKATVVAKDLEIWAQDSIVQNSFPELAKSLSSSSIDTGIYRGESGWVGLDRNGRPLTSSSPQRPESPSVRELLSVKHRSSPGTLGLGSICIRLPGGYDESTSSYVTTIRDPYQGGNIDAHDKTKAYLNMLVGLGAATSGPVNKMGRSGVSMKYLEYRFSPEIKIRDRAAGGQCLEVATTTLELLHAHRDGDHRVLVKGLQRAHPSHSWVRAPAFLAEHPDVAEQISKAQPVMSTLRIAQGQPTNMENWLIP